MYCERNAKGAIVEIKKTNTVEEFKAAIRAQQVPILLRFALTSRSPSARFCSRLLSFRSYFLNISGRFTQLFVLLRIYAHHLLNFCLTFAQDAMAPEFEGTSLLLGGRIEMFEGKARQTVDLGKTCDPCGKGFSKTNQVCVKPSRFPARQRAPAFFLPAPPARRSVFNRHRGTQLTRLRFCRSPNRRSVSRVATSWPPSSSRAR